MKYLNLAFLLLLSLAMTTIAAAQHDSGHKMDHSTEMKSGKVSHDQSLHNMQAVWTDQNGHKLQIRDLAGEPLIVVMFYGQCAETCPILIQRAWMLYSSLTPDLQEQVNVLAVSFDYKNDTPEALKEYAQHEQLDLPGWHFVTATRNSIRELSALLGVQYRERSDGHFDHSNLITVLDQHGNIALRIEGATGELPEFPDQMKELITVPNQ